MERIKIEHQKQFDATTVRFYGIIDNTIQEQLEKVFSEISSKVILDFSQSDRINSMGITVLLKQLKAFQQQGGSIYYTNLNRLNTKLFRMVGLTKLGKIFHHIQDAFRYIETS